MEDLHAACDNRKNVFYIPEDAWLGTGRDHYQLGDKTGEEVFGHCYRYHHLSRNGNTSGETFPLGGEVERGDVEEFYGYVGRKIFLKMLVEQGAVDIFFPRRMVTPPKEENAVTQQINTLRALLRDWLMPAKKAIQDEIDCIERHRIGYGWANALDISAIPWDRMADIYSLSTEEAMRRFFRADPDLNDFTNSSLHIC